MLFSFLPAQDTHTGVRNVNYEKKMSPLSGSLTHILYELISNYWCSEAGKLLLITSS